MESDAVVRRVSDGLQRTLARLSTLAVGVAAIAASVAAATFATGLWVFDGSDRTAWIIAGGLLCATPTLAALVAWLLLRITARYSSELVANVRSFIGGASPSARVLIDYDIGQPVATTSRRFTALRAELYARSKELPALYAGVRAIVSVPALAAVAVLGTCAVGAVGTVLLIGHLIA
jgi:hypothetical protein